MRDLIIRHRRSKERAVEILCKQRRRSQDENSRWHHRRERAGTSDNTKIPGRKGLAHNRQERKIAIRQSWNNHDGRKPSEKYEAQREGIERHDDRVAT